MRKLPIAATQFCHARVPVGYDIELIVDGNSKITSSNGSFAKPAPNAFSLPAASVDGSAWCPGSTSACRSSCYVKGLANNAPHVYDAYRQNAASLARILNMRASMQFDVALAFATWITDNARGGFRWHVSGDVLNQAHAEWIADVCALAPDVPFWIYTRTLSVVSTLAAERNLAVNVSADFDNITHARAVARRYGVRLAYLVNADDLSEPYESHPAGCLYCTGVPSLPEGSVIFPDYALRGRKLDDPISAPWWRRLSAEQKSMVCPADFFGQSEAHRCGPCAKCLT